MGQIDKLCKCEDLKVKQPNCGQAQTSKKMRLCARYFTRTIHVYLLISKFRPPDIGRLFAWLKEGGKEGTLLGKGPDLFAKAGGVFGVENFTINFSINS